MSWDDKLLKQAKKIIKLYPQKRSALGPLLHLAQSKDGYISCLLYTSPSPRDYAASRMPSSA